MYFILYLESLYLGPARKELCKFLFSFFVIYEKGFTKVSFVLQVDLKKSVSWWVGKIKMFFFDIQGWHVKKKNVANIALKIIYPLIIYKQNKYYH